MNLRFKINNVNIEHVLIASYNSNLKFYIKTKLIVKYLNTKHITKYVLCTSTHALAYKGQIKIKTLNA